MVCLRIQRHGASSDLGLDIGYVSVLTGRILVDDAEHAFAARSERQARGRVEAAGVGVLSNFGRRNDFAGIRVRNGQLLAVAAAAEHATVCGVHGDARWRLAARHRIFVLDGHRLRINFNQRIFIFDVQKDAALAVQRGRLRFAGKLNRADDLSRRCVNHGCVGGFAVECPHPLVRCVIKNGVGILAGHLDRRELLQRCDIEDRDRVRQAVARIALSKILRQRDTVYILGVGNGNVANDFALVLVDNHHVRPACDIDSPRLGIHSQIVPSTFPAHRHFLQQVIPGAWRRGVHSASRKEKRQQRWNTRAAQQS